MRVLPFRFSLLAALAVLSGACTSAVSESAPTTAPTTTVATTTPPTTPPTTQLEVVTTIRRVPSPELASPGHITIGGVQYDFAFECWAAGAGDILALGVGDEPGTREPTQAIVQAFFGQTYVSVVIDGDRVLELAIDEPADLFVQSDTIRGGALRFVDAAGSAGVGESMGLGTVTVECNGFAPGLPDGYDIS
ncbi:MAG: hypothetical protein ACI81L_002763 [Verrucomicrobiales bacterium]|jgi:hypothetical protein